MPSTRILLVTGECVEAEGSVEDIERRLSDAARSSAGALAWVKDAQGEEPVAVNPAHVVTLRPGDE